MVGHEVAQSEPPLQVPPISLLPHGSDEAEITRLVSTVHALDGAPDPAAVRELKKLTLGHVFDEVAFEHRHFFGWPTGLYIPAEADASEWPFLTGSPNRFAQSWTNGIGWSEADHRDGSLFASASSPTVSGAIDGTAEAGLGIRYTATDSLARIRVKPDLRFTGRFIWDMEPPRTVWTSVRAVASVHVGGFELDPVTNRWAAITTSPWRRFTVFHRQLTGSATFPLELTSFARSGSEVSGEVLVQGGRTYLISVVAQIELRITTTDSGGRHVTVTDGRFDTMASLSGLVPEIWIDKTVYIA